MPEPPDKILKSAYAHSLRLLRENSTAKGVIACARSKRAIDRHYVSIFGRDAAICALGLTSSEDPKLIRIARQSLLTLAEHQAPNGQIPKYVKPESREVDFWYSGCIDATLWWLIAVNFYQRMFPGEHLARELEPEIKSAINWLFCQEHQGMFLLQQNEASDWADIMPRSGFVLYSNALWYHVKKLYKIPKADKTRHFFNQIFSPFDTPIPEQRRIRILTHYVKQKGKKSDFYLSFVNFSFFGEDVDVFGNILAALFGLSAHSRASKMVDRMLDEGINEPWPVKTVLEPIEKDSPLWRQYMHRHRQNLPFQYHNGGIWPFIGGFWVILLAKLGKKELALRELARVAEVNRVNDWQFNEWFHGKTGKPMGMPGQSWNAALFILGYNVVYKGLKI